MAHLGRKPTTLNLTVLFVRLGFVAWSSLQAALMYKALNSNGKIENV